MSVKGFNSRETGVGAVFEDTYIIKGKRSPFGKMKGSLATINPTDLAILTARAVIAEAGIDAKTIDQTIAANIANESADAFFLPRHIALYSGAPETSPALLSQRICGSGLEVIGQAAEQIGMGKGNLVLASGTEVMSRMPLVSFDARMGFDLGRPNYKDMLWEALDDTAAVPMGQTADNLAREYKLSREKVDKFAKRSQDRYFAANEAGFFKDEILPIEAKGVIETEGLKPRKYRLNAKETVSQDEHPRQATLDKLAKLPNVFSKEGPTSPGNASGIVDGACSVLIASKEYIETHGIKPLAKIRCFSSVGVRPDIMGIGPVPAIKSALSALNLSINDVDHFEINEAFSAQCLAVSEALELNEDKLNVHGGAISIGHPLATTGLRLVTTLLNTLHKNDKSFGVASACIGGGQGIAMVVERC